MAPVIWESHEPFCAAWVGDAGWLSLESDFSKGSFGNPAVVLPSCKEAAFQTSPACRVLSRCGVSGEAGPDADGSGANPMELDPSSRPRSCLRVCLGRFALFQGKILVVGLDGWVWVDELSQGVAAGWGETA